MNWKIIFAGLFVLILSGAMLVSCKLSTSELAKQVQEHIVETLSENGVNVRVTKDLQLVKKGNNEYSGIMTISAGGQTQQISVNVVYDGKSFSWEIE